MKNSLIPDINTLRVFESAARHDNFTRAAEELNLTQSAVSRHILNLEQQMKLELFKRVRQRVILTDVGKRILPEVRKLIIQSEDLMLRAVASASMEATLNIATLPTLGSRWLMPRLPDFITEWPSLALTIESKSEPFDFSQEPFDLAIHYGQPTWAKAHSEFLFQEVVIPVANQNLINKLKITTANDLGKAPLIHLTTRPRLWSDWMQSNGVNGNKGISGDLFDQFSMIIAAASAGLGVALLPSYLIENELKTGILLPILNAPMVTENAYYVVVPEGQQSSKASTAFKEWLLNQCNSAMDFANI